MKKLLTIMVLIMMPIISLQAQKAISLKISWKFEGIEEGYDHLSMTRVFVDGNQVAVSKEMLQSKPGKMKVTVPAGMHRVLIVNYAKYEGLWEEHTIENNYSIDCLWELNQNFTKSMQVKLVFDLNSATKATIK